MLKYMLLALFLVGGCTNKMVDTHFDKMEVRHPRFALYGGLGTAANPLAPFRGAPLNSTLMDTYARYPEIVLPLSPAGDDRIDILAGLYLRNLRQIRIAYVLVENTGAHWDAPENANQIGARVHNIIQAAGAWHLADWTSSLINVDITAEYTPPGGAKTTVGMAIMEEWCKNLDAWDGLFLDVFCDFPPNEYTGSAATWRQVAQDMQDYARKALGTRKLIVGNCAVQTKYDRLNGWMRESFPNQNGGTWESNMLDGSPTYPGGYLTDAGLYQPKPYMGFIFSAASGGPTYAPTNTENQRRLRYGLGSACMGDGAHVFAPSDIDLATQYYNWFFDEYSVTPDGVASTLQANTLWLGRPIGQPTHYFDPVWSRQFEKGLVLLNTTTLPQTVALNTGSGFSTAFPGVYKRISGSINPANNGAKVDTVIVPATDAVFLVRIQ